MKSRPRLRTLPHLPAALLLALPLAAPAAPLWQDTFETDTSANWTVKVGYYDGTASDDYSVDWAFDYGQLKYKIYKSAADDAPVESPIPPAPHSDGTTKGLRISVNKKDSEAARFAVNLFPKNQNFSGNFVLKFDMFLAHSAYTDAGVGTTEYGLFGINHSGNHVNWFALNGTAQRADFLSSAVGRDNSDGLFFALTGDGGAARDAVSLQGVAGGAPLPKMADSSGGLTDRNSDGAIDSNTDVDTYFANVFPAGKFEEVGFAGKRWLAVEISQVGDLVTWKIDGHVIAQRTNDTTFKSGTIMLGCSDPFTSISDPLEETFVLFDNVRVEPVRTVVVDTADNASPAGDGKTSLKEALAAQQPNDIIRFNIPGAGPHVIPTPLGGYPLITSEGLVIDGYSQPGASPNTLGVLEGNNAQLRIVLDSSGDEQEGDPTKPLRRSTRLPFPGYSDSENGILGVYGAENVTIKGLSLVARHTPGSDDDPSIYCIALVNSAENARVQGNWFGVLPDGKTVKGAASAVAAFRHRVNVDGANVDTYSGGLIFGTDSDTLEDRAERNVVVGTHIALALELPHNRVHGNYFNVLPDGKTFLDPDDIHQAQLDTGRSPNDSSVENYENGRQTEGSVLGTDGNRINDAEERNVFGHVKYEHSLEFYSNANNCVIAGNYFGVGIDGTSLAPTADGMDPDLAELPGTSSVRIGTNGDGFSDNVEGNWVFGVPGNDIIVAGAQSPVVIRGNRFSNNGFEAFPWFDSGTRAYAEYYASILLDPTQPLPVITKLQNGVIEGRTPLTNTGEWPWEVMDLYVIDDLAAAKGFNIPGRLLGSLIDNNSDTKLGPLDNNGALGEFSFDVSSFGLPPGSKIAAAVTYSFDQNVTQSGRARTGPLSEPFLVPGEVAKPIQITAITRAATGATLAWTGGTAPFKVQSRTSVAGGAWTDVATTNERTATVNVTTGPVFYRIAGQ